MKRSAVLVTGSNGAIGTAIVMKLKESGYFVYGLDKYADANGCHGFIELDLEAFVEDEQVQQKALSQVVEQLGEIELVAIVNNAAIQIVKDWQLLTTSDLRRSISVNAFAVVILAKLFFSLLKDFLAYSISKAALDGVTRGLAIEMGGKVAINTINPAAIDTPMLRAGFASRDMISRLSSSHPAQTIGTPFDIAEVVTFLVNSGSNFLTNTSINIDGGIGALLHDPSLA